MYKIRYAEVSDAKVLGEIHSKSWKLAYKNIVPDSFLENISAEKRQKYFEKALLEKNKEDAKQPFYVWYPFVLAGGIVTLLLIPNYFMLRKRLIEIELYKMEIKDI